MTQGGQSILRAITKQASNDTGGQKVGPIKIKSMNALLAARRGEEKNTLARTFIFFPFQDTSYIHFTVRCNTGWKTHTKYLFQSISPELDFTGHLLITRCGIMPPHASQSLPDKLPDSGGVRARVTSAL